jgi:uncharacterized membrane protein
MVASAVVNLLHLIAAVFWIGGMAFVNLVLEPSLKELDPVQRGKLMGTIGKRFTIVAWGSVLLLLVSGFIKTPDGLLFDTSDAYGTTLLLKHIVVLLMILFGLRIAVGLIPKIRREAPQPGQAPSPEFLKAQGQFQLLSRVNFILGLIVLVLVALL